MVERIIPRWLGRTRFGGVKGLFIERHRETQPGHWLLRYTSSNGRERWMGLGSLQYFDIHEARERARAARKLVAQGIDPIDDRRKKRAEARHQPAMLFATVLNEYCRKYDYVWSSPSTQKQYRHLLMLLIRACGQRPVNTIDHAAVLSLLEPLAPSTMAKLGKLLSRVMEFARAKGWYAKPNPAKWESLKVELKEKLPKPDPVKVAAAIERRVMERAAYELLEEMGMIESIKHKRGERPCQ